LFLLSYNSALHCAFLLRFAIFLSQNAASLWWDCAKSIVLCYAAKRKRSQQKCCDQISNAAEGNGPCGAWSLVLALGKKAKVGFWLTTDFATGVVACLWLGLGQCAAARRRLARPPHRGNFHTGEISKVTFLLLLRSQ